MLATISYPVEGSEEVAVSVVASVPEISVLAKCRDLGTGCHHEAGG